MEISSMSWSYFGGIGQLLNHGNENFDEAARLKREGHYFSALRRGIVASNQVAAGYGLRGAHKIFRASDVIANRITYVFDGKNWGGVNSIETKQSANHHGFFNRTRADVLSEDPNVNEVQSRQ